MPTDSSKAACPNCGSDDQYGDNCEQCGATYDATDLKNPRSLISGATPVLARSQHYFFDLPQFTDMLKAWTVSGTLQNEVANKLAEWLDSGLKPWDISRDAPYFGFLIPGTQDKYFYVWMDAPIGYMASLRNYCAAHNDVVFDDFWDPDAATEVHHFIGKDIVNFHALFWPAVLEGAGYRKPTRIHTHGFITVDGTKMSKSRGTFINSGHVPESSESGISALLLRDEIERHRRRHRHHVRRFRAACELRSGWQNRQHRQPLRGIHQQAQ